MRKAYNMFANTLIISDYDCVTAFGVIKDGKELSEDDVVYKEIRKISTDAFNVDDMKKYLIKNLKKKFPDYTIIYIADAQVFFTLNRRE